MIIIQQYQNRKLYNKNSHKYVTLDWILKEVKNGAEILIRDRKAQDITAKTFFKALEQSKIPQNICEELIKIYG